MTGDYAVKSVLRAAGGHLRAEPELAEAAILMRACATRTLQKFCTRCSIFLVFLVDLFPGIDPPRKIDPALQDACKESANNETGRYGLY